MADADARGQAPDADATGTPRFRHTGYRLRVTDEVRIRPVQPEDLPILFEYEADPEAAHMAVFASRDRASFDAHWAKVLANETAIARTVEDAGIVVGNIGCWEQDGERHVGYWIGREHWGRGVATEALRALVAEVTDRPLHADVVETNAGSIRVLEKCGFRRVGDPTVSDEGVVELRYRLDGTG
jgi:RimJ/RimL family protein N-acetyltransferase